MGRGTHQHHLAPGKLDAACVGIARHLDFMAERRQIV
jgi:hypothetical protein